MTSKEQAKKGFKTFLLTLVISLVIFSGIYYLINAEHNDGRSSDFDSVETPEDVLGSKLKEDKVETLGESDSRNDESVFADLAGQKTDEYQNTEVLAGSDSMDTTSTIDNTATTDTTAVVAESTVPDTGVSGPTIGVVMTLVILGFAAYIMFLGPRNVALHNFEKDVIDDLE